MIENSIGSRLFSSLFVTFEDGGDTADILNDGELSCAFFVSSLLTLAGVMEKPCATVKKLTELITNDPLWVRVEEADATVGDVVIYKKVIFEDETEHAHIGLALNEDEVVSTSYEKKEVVRHPIDYRPIESVHRYTWSRSEKTH